MKVRCAVVVPIVASASVGLVGCAAEPVSSSMSIPNSADNIHTGLHTVHSATTTTNGFGTNFELGFTILNRNGIKLQPDTGLQLSGRSHTPGTDRWSLMTTDDVD